MEKVNYLRAWILKRIKRNQNLIGVITGQTGSGKTYAGMSFLESLSQDLGTNFCIKDIVFSPKEFMQRINSGELKRGSCLLFDEAGVGYSSREWFSISNKLINYLMQTFRHRNYVVIFTTPDMSFIDKNARKLIHLHFETQSIDYWKKLVITKPFLAQNNQRSGKTYWKYLRVPVPNTIIPLKIERACFGMPSAKLVKEYEQKKSDYTDKLNKDIEDSLTGKVVKRELTDAENRYYTLSKMGLSVRDIADKEKVDVQSVYQAFKRIRAKGHTFDNDNSFKGKKGVSIV